VNQKIHKEIKPGPTPVMVNKPVVGLGYMFGDSLLSYMVIFTFVRLPASRLATRVTTERGGRAQFPHPEMSLRLERL
jgi:hypothetical protein